eukprot:1096333-Pelagomonas_calceolata.AAC.1
MQDAAGGLRHRLLDAWRNVFGSGPAEPVTMRVYVLCKGNTLRCPGGVRRHNFLKSRDDHIKKFVFKRKWRMEDGEWKMVNGKWVSQGGSDFLGPPPGIFSLCNFLAACVNPIEKYIFGILKLRTINWCIYGFNRRRSVGGGPSGGHHRTPELKNF